MNAYPEKPSLDYEPTTVPMAEVVAYLSGLNIPVEVKRAAYVVFRIESGNGQHGINNNYIGAQADGNRWPAKWDSAIIGTVTMPENQTGKERIFCAFASWHTSCDLLADRLQARGLYVGAPGINSDTTLAEAYYRQWVTGNPQAAAPAAVLASFASMYGQSLALFRVAPVPPAPPPVVPPATLVDIMAELRAQRAMLNQILAAIGAEPIAANPTPSVAAEAS